MPSRAQRRSCAPSSELASTCESTVTVSTGGATFADDREIVLTLTGTATKGTDYTVGSETLTLAAGAMSVETTVTAVDDAVDEAAETIVVAAEGAQRTITITDDDTTSFTVTASPSSVAEAGGESTVTVSTGGVTFADDREITLTLTGTATKGTDYTVGSETLTLTAGATSVETTVTALNDGVDEGNETIVVAAEGAQETITITDDDEADFTLTVSPDSIAEAGGVSTVTVSTGGVTFVDDREIALALTGTATKDADYTVASETLTLPAGETSSATTVTAVDDALAEGDEPVEIAASVDGASVGEAQTIVIADDDAAGVVVDGAGAYSIVLTSQPSGPVELSVTVPAGTDLTASPSTLTFTAASWESAQTVAVAVAEDDDAVSDEATLTHAVRGGGYDGVTAAPVMVTVVDDDPSPVSGDAGRRPGGGERGGGADRADGDGGAERPPGLGHDGGGGGARGYGLGGDGLCGGDGGGDDSGGGDGGYGGADADVVDDGDDEPDETVTVSGRSGDLAVAPAAVTILDDDEPNRPPVFTAEHGFELEENRPGSVELGTVTAVDPDDDPVTYALTSGPRDRFAVGVRSGTVSYVGPGEDFERGPTGYELRVEARDPEGLTATASVAVTVLDVAEAPAAVGVIPAQALDEGAGPVTLELSAYFADGDGDALRYEAASANEASATVSGLDADGDGGGAGRGVGDGDGAGLGGAEGDAGVRGDGERPVGAGGGGERAGRAGSGPPVERTHDPGAACGIARRRAVAGDGGGAGGAAGFAGHGGDVAGVGAQLAAAGDGGAVPAVRLRPDGGPGPAGAGGLGRGPCAARGAGVVRRWHGARAAGVGLPAVGSRRAGRGRRSRAGPGLDGLGAGGPADVPGRPGGDAAGAGLRRRPADVVSRGGRSAGRALAGGDGAGSQRGRRGVGARGRRRGGCRRR